MRSCLLGLAAIIFIIVIGFAACNDQGRRDEAAAVHNATVFFLRPDLAVTRPAPAKEEVP